MKEIFKKNTSIKKVGICFFYFLIIVFGFGQKCNSQEIFEIEEAKSLTKFPFTVLTGGCIIIKARIDNFSDTLNFVFDTGSGGISLDSTTVNNLNLKRTKSNRTIRGIAGIKTVDFTLKHTLQLPKLSVDSLDFHINNYDILTSSYGVKIDGIIGYSFIRRHIIKLNYDSNTIEILSPGTIKYPKNGYLMKPKFTTLPIETILARDETKITTPLIFDTGAGLNLLLSEELITDKDFLKKKKKFYPVKTEGLGGQKTMKTTTIKEFSLGPYKFRNVPTLIFEDDYNITNYPQMGGVLGNDILRRFNTIINYPDFAIHLKPNSHFYEDFDYAYTGLSIFLIDKKVVVIDVMEGSPAYKAGIKVDDIIFALDNNFTGNLQTYKTALQNSGNRIKILILRNGFPKEVYLNVQNIKR